MHRTLALTLLLCSVLCGAAPVAARAERGGPASGFLMQALLGASASVVGNNTAAVAVSTGLRLGAMLDPLFVAARLTYINASTPGASGGYTGVNYLALGPDIAPFLWRSYDGNARLYLLIGFNVSFNITTTRGNNDTAYGGGFNLGLGGAYFLHRNFALGVELGSRTDLAKPGGDVNVSSYLYAALSGAFVAGK